MKYAEVQDVTLKMIINEGFIKANINVYATSDINIVGKLDKDGAIILKLDGVEKIYPFPSGAARAIVKTSVNGWKFWKIIFNDKLVELSEIKKLYLTK